MYFLHLNHKKTKTDADTKLIESFNHEVIGPAYRQLESSQREKFKTLWEDEIVKHEYDNWRNDSSGRSNTWFSKITPCLHLRVILDKIEHSTTL
jgi:hypothetical protein